MKIGVVYYPEHWPRSRWPLDIELMHRAGFNVVRLCEFAWSRLEPEEGRYDFEIFDEVLSLLNDNGISAILGTPTAGMPAWVARKYPETLAVDAHDHRLKWGTRKTNCFTSGTYRLLSERIAEAMARHFGKICNVVGWQIDNEFRGPICHCNSCLREWQEWLARKYQTIDEVNRAWGTHFWSHTLKRWDEIVTPSDPMRHNPSACLDWQRFHSWLTHRFLCDQVSILRTHCPNQFILHNCILGRWVEPEVDNHALARELDFIGWDNYPIHGKPEIPYYAAFTADLVRNMKKKSFWVMEQTAGAPGDACFYRNPRPGEIRKTAYQQLARGGDNQLWFRWRTCTAGREQYWHGLLGHDGAPARRYEEAAKTAREFRKLHGSLKHSSPVAPVAMLYDYDSMWALRFQPGFQQNHYRQSLLLYYKVLFHHGVAVDIIEPGEEFSEYKAVLAPGLHVLPDPLAHRLIKYIEEGGTFLADCRFAVKNESNLCLERTLPGLLSTALGITIEEYEAVADDVQEGVEGFHGLEGRFAAKHYMDWINPEKATTLAGYLSWHLTPYAAATRNQFGKGIAYYVGTRIDEEVFYDLLIKDLFKQADIQPMAQIPAGVEVHWRRSPHKSLLFVINHTEKHQELSFPGKPDRELIRGAVPETPLQLPRYEVAVLEYALQNPFHHP